MKLRINWLLLGVLSIIFLLRLPSLFEPYWYGDEGIYLAIGQAMQRGAILYRDIWDNKPPLLYIIYAVSPTVIWAKLTATACVLGTCAGVYYLSRKIKIPALLATLITGVFLSLPTLEGTIANAELYFTLPIVWSAYFFLVNRYLIAVGFLASMAAMLKIPALFDFFGLGLAYIVSQKSLRGIPKMAIGFLPLVIIFLVYFQIAGGLGDFLIGSFSQNASYVSVDSGPLNRLSNPLFTKGLILLASSAIITFLYWKKKVSKEFLFLTLWFGFSLYGALLSNRPYRHYLLQIVPPATILTLYLVRNIFTKSLIRQSLLGLLVMIAIFSYLFRMFDGSFALGVQSYYKNFFDYISERKSWQQYASYFDGRTLNAYNIADYLKANTQESDTIFVWSDASFIYVLSDLAPATKFIQAHHLSTIDPVNYDRVIDKLNITQPEFILIARPVHFAFPKLEELVKEKYELKNKIADMEIYQKSE